MVSKRHDQVAHVGVELQIKHGVHVRLENLLPQLVADKLHVFLCLLFPLLPGFKNSDNTLLRAQKRHIRLFKRLVHRLRQNKVDVEVGLLGEIHLEVGLKFLLPFSGLREGAEDRFDIGEALVVLTLLEPLGQLQEGAFSDRLGSLLVLAVGAVAGSVVERGRNAAIFIAEVSFLGSEGAALMLQRIAVLLVGEAAHFLNRLLEDLELALLGISLPKFQGFTDDEPKVPLVVTALPAPLPSEVVGHFLAQGQMTVGNGLLHN